MKSFVGDTMDSLPDYLWPEICSNELWCFCNHNSHWCMTKTCTFFMLTAQPKRSYCTA